VDDLTQRAPIFLIAGTPGAGKTTVARALMRRLAFGAHIPVDDVREFVVSGIAQPVPAWTDETTRQFRLARDAAAHMARVNADAGFAVAIDDVIFPDEAERCFVKPLRDHAVHKILLRPALEIAQQRSAMRTSKEFDAVVLHEPIRTLYDEMDARNFTAHDWVIVDSSALTIEETVEMILRRTLHRASVEERT